MLPVPACVCQQWGKATIDRRPAAPAPSAVRRQRRPHVREAAPDREISPRQLFGVAIALHLTQITWSPHWLDIKHDSDKTNCRQSVVLVLKGPPSRASAAKASCEKSWILIPTIVSEVRNVTSLLARARNVHQGSTRRRHTERRHRSDPMYRRYTVETKLNRRTLSRTAGVLAGGAVVARLTSTSAQESTPAASPAASPVASPVANTGTITGLVTDDTTGEPLADVYITVGWETFRLATITDADGRYTVPNVPTGESAPVLGFHDGGYRYWNSEFDSKIDIVLEPGETYTFDFTLVPLNEPAGEPQLSNAAISPDRVSPGAEVTFEVTAKGGEGGLSPEVIAANPQVGRMILMESVGGDRFRAAFTISPETPPGDYAFAFFAASNACYVNSEFPVVTLHIV